MVKPVFDQPADLEILDQNIGLTGQRLRRGAVLRLPKIQHNRAFAAVRRVEIGCGPVARAIDEGRAPLAGVVAAGRLDLDHLGPQIGQHLAGPGPGQNARQFQNLQSGQRRRHGA
jgi:hypothetical protein